MGTNRTRNSAPSGSNKTREGFAGSMRWQDANEAYEDVNDTFDTYGDEIDRNESGTNRTRH